MYMGWPIVPRVNYNRKFQNLKTSEVIHYLYIKYMYNQSAKIGSIVYVLDVAMVNFALLTAYIDWYSLCSMPNL